MNLLKGITRAVVRRVFRVEVRGEIIGDELQGPLLVVANHTSFIDGLLLWAFLPLRLTFAVNTHVAHRWYMRWLACVRAESTHLLSHSELVRASMRPAAWARPGAPWSCS